ncbi:Uncharacterized protein TCM_009353 [Theobroma cacao]|uniref:Uncharacterized protein n=1 Tax=Theobroma cacao TaxID=3641 RepID=A0A061E6M1_THECC|nr:Uncharacterized protein TCM_009353 [Theobroma cacao]
MYNNDTKLAHFSSLWPAKARTKEEKEEQNLRWKNSREKCENSRKQVKKGGELSGKSKEIVPEDQESEYSEFDSRNTE